LAVFTKGFCNDACVGNIAQADISLRCSYISIWLITPIGQKTD
jgi:hypothetical protein